MLVFMTKTHYKHISLVEVNQAIFAWSFRGRNRRYLALKEYGSSMNFYACLVFCFDQLKLNPLFLILLAFYENHQVSEGGPTPPHSAHTPGDSASGDRR